MYDHLEDVITEKIANGYGTAENSCDIARNILNSPEMIAIQKLLYDKYIHKGDTKTHVGSELMELPVTVRLWVYELLELEPAIEDIKI